MSKMSRDTIKTQFELEQDTDGAIKKWAKHEGRSKRRHAAIVLRKLIEVAKTERDTLKRLGLVTD